MTESLSAWYDRNPRPCLALVVLAGLSIRLFHLTHYSLNGDELFSVYFMKRGIRFLWTEGLHTETNPPFYYTLLLLWSRVFGDGAAALRMLSVIASTAAIPLLYRLGRMVGGSRLGLLAAALFAASPTQIYYAQDLRSYALIPAFTCMTLIGFLEFMERREHMPEARPGRWAFWYVPGSVLLSYCHFVEPLFLAACALWGLIFLAAARAAPRRIAGWLGAHLLIGLLVLPEAIGMMTQTDSPNTGWIVRPTFGLVYGAASFAFGILTDHPEFMILFVGAAAAMAVGHRWKLRPREIALVAAPLTATLMLIGLSFLHPAFVPRTQMATSVPATLLAAYLILCFPVVLVRLALLGVLAWGYGQGLYADAFAAYNEPWEKIAGLVAAHVEPGDELVVSLATPTGAFAYYTPGQPKAEIRQWGPDGTSASAQSRLWASFYGTTSITTTGIVADVSRGRTVWVILTRLDLAWYATLETAMPDATRQILYDDGNILVARL